jgi:hypothetical protein
MKRKEKLPFDPKEFLAKVGEGKTISKYRKEQIVSRKDRSRTRFSTSRKARSNSPSFPSRERGPDRPII